MAPGGGPYPPLTAVYSGPYRSGMEIPHILDIVTYDPPIRPAADVWAARTRRRFVVIDVGLRVGEDETFVYCIEYGTGRGPNADYWSAPSSSVRIVERSGVPMDVGLVRVYEAEDQKAHALNVDHGSESLCGVAVSPRDRPPVLAHAMVQCLVCRVLLAGIDLPALPSVMA